VAILEDMIGPRSTRVDRYPPRLSDEVESRSSNVGSGPEAAENDVCSNVGYWGLSGLVVLTLSFVGHDPKPTWSMCCAALSSARC
jgi:hypothetical protein